VYDLKLAHYSDGIYVVMDPFYAYYAEEWGILTSRIARIFPESFIPVGSMLSLCALKYAIILYRVPH
jgi:hypothetical protein